MRVMRYMSRGVEAEEEEQFRFVEKGEESRMRLDCSVERTTRPSSLLLS